MIGWFRGLRRNSRDHLRTKEYKGFFLSSVNASFPNVSHLAAALGFWLGKKQYVSMWSDKVDFNRLPSTRGDGGAWLSARTMLHFQAMSRYPLVAARGWLGLAVLGGREGGGGNQRGFASLCAPWHGKQSHSASLSPVTFVLQLFGSSLPSVDLACTLLPIYLRFALGVQALDDQFLCPARTLKQLYSST